MRKSMENQKMSDEIKTGHSALGLLMAECEQLRRDLAQAKADNARLASELELAKGIGKGYANEVGKLQYHLDEAKAENQRLSELLWGSRCVYCGEVIGKDKQNQDIADELLRKHVEVCPKHPVASLKSELAQAKAENEELSKLASLKLARGRIKELQAENARLAAALTISDEVIDELSHHWSTHRNEYDRFDLVQKRITAFRENRGAALRDLLAPTIELLEEIDNYTFMMGAKKFNASIQNELARLRAITKK